MTIILGIFIMVVGAYMVVRTEDILSFFGRIAWFEAHLGTEGGSRLGYKLTGIIAIFIGILIMTGMIGGFITWVFSPLLRYSQP
ncbi:MAG: hypothetical protein PHT51_00240 [Patescibacteria group bacterium]|nr:hypothetical protein [Patescibacteria group bacterium]MDD4610662.1 hypothetical protein [Patescibacteria group bacterium]